MSDFGIFDSDSYSLSISESEHWILNCIWIKCICQEEHNYLFIKMFCDENKDISNDLTFSENSLLYK